MRHAWRLASQPSAKVRAAVSRGQGELEQIQFLLGHVIVKTTSDMGLQTTFPKSRRGTIHTAKRAWLRE
jgi:hypothetical protein